LVAPVGGGVSVGLEDGFTDVGFKLEEADGVADVMDVTRVVGLDVDGCGAFCLMLSCANEEAGRMMDRKRRLEENGRLDFVQRHVRLERVFRRFSMFDNVHKKGMKM
jgi:hypothetical protein